MATGGKIRGASADPIGFVWHCLQKMDSLIAANRQLLRALESGDPKLIAEARNLADKRKAELRRVRTAYRRRKESQA